MIKYSFFALLLAGCFSPQYKDGDLKCAPIGQACPTGYHCASTNTCFQNGHDPSPYDLGGDLADPGDAAPDDQAPFVAMDLAPPVRDLGSADLTPGVKKQGEACGGNSECGTAGGCVDGRCCDTACAGACTACNLAGHEGTCTPVATGGAPTSSHGSCGPDPMASCQRDGTCDGKGACHKWPLGTVCKSPTCDATSNQVTSQATCDGAGACNVPPAITCAPFLCKDASACYSSCTQTPMQCSSGNTCVSGSCGLKANGASCTATSECMSGFCVDGVCCNSACGGTCQSCSLSASLGNCSLVPAGQDPRHVCPAATGNNATCTPGGCSGTAQSCLVAAAGTGCGASCSGGAPVSLSCDAAGSCSRSSSGSPCPTCQNCTASASSASCQPAPNNSSCGAAVCSSTAGYVVPAPLCMSGMCVAQAQVSCGGELCSGGACKGSCSTPSDCVPGDYCSNGSCVPQSGTGGACTSPAQCSSGFCVDGVCCNSACGGTCQSCNLSGSVGACSTVPAGQDPRHVCPAGTGNNATCSPGGCSGSAGSCQIASAGTACGASCTGNAPVNLTCDASGACSKSSTGNACPTCQMCAAGATSASCQPAGNGSTCGTATCASQTAYVPAPVCSNGMCVAQAQVACSPGNCSGGACTCAPSSSGANQYVDGTMGTDDTSHGGGTGTCAYKTIGYALGIATGTITLAASQVFTNESWPLNLNGTQQLNCNGASIIAATSVLTFNGTSNALLNCAVSCNSAANSTGLSVASAGSGGHTVQGGQITDCGWGIATGVTANLIVSSVKIGNYGVYGIQVDTSNSLHDPHVILNGNVFSAGPSSSGDILCGWTFPHVSGTGNTGVNKCLNCPQCPFR